MPRSLRFLLPSFAALTVLLCGSSLRAESPAWSVEPADVLLHGNYAQVQLVISRARPSEGGATDGTRLAAYRSENDQIARVDERGRVYAVGNGTTQLVADVAGQTLTIPVSVDGVAAEAQPDFMRDVAPILSKAGCNMGACHASQYGKGGFILSVFGFDPKGDHAAIVRDRQQRRVNVLDPEQSLFLQKPTMRVPHGGARRLTLDSPDYRLLADWIRSGAPGPVADPAKVVALKVSPAQLVSQPGETQQLRVVAEYKDGRRADVTAWARFDSMDEGVLEVDETGFVKVLDRGQAPVMVRFEGQADIGTFVVPYRDNVTLAGWENRNFVDEHASAKFRQLGIEPSPLADDAAFLRRAFLDATGSLPTIEETRLFLSDSDPNKREHLIDRLLGLTGDPNLDIYNDRYASFWTLKWADLIRNNSKDVGDQGMWALHNWLRGAFLDNRPFGKMVSELVTAKGSIYSTGPANYFRINKNPTELAEATAQLFLGVRLQCAQCHHHPFEKYGQEDYYSFAAFFSRIGTKNSQDFGVFGRETIVMVRSAGDVRHPRTGQVMQPTPLEGEPVDSELDRRIPLAEWLTAHDNRMFARSIVNRYVSYLLGRGLVEPVDDMRGTNPPTNVELMEALTQHFIDSGHDLKQLMRAIMVSRLYQLDSQPLPENASDRKFYSHYFVKRIAAEPLLDAVDYATGDPTKFQNLPVGTRAIDLPDAEYPDYFLNVFAKPRRASVCECERMPDENLSQALHTLNGDVLAKKIASANGRVATLLKEKKPHEEIVNDLYLATLTRLPSEAEMQATREFLEQSPSEKECYEDLLWALLNSKQFLFVR